jgi:hypothetical protein
MAQIESSMNVDFLPMNTTGPTAIYCYNDDNSDREYIPVFYDGQKFDQMCDSFKKFPGEPIAIPIKKYYVMLFLNFLDSKQVPGDFKDLIEILNIAQFCGLTSARGGKFCLVNEIRKKIVTVHNIPWRVLHKYILSRAGSTNIFDYDVNRFVLSNLTDLYEFCSISSIA